MEEKLLGCDCDEEDAGGGEEGAVAGGVVGDVFWVGVHPGAEEDGGWVVGWGGDGSSRGEEGDDRGEAGEAR